MGIGKSVRSILVISWLALLISVAVTGDTVIDLVFEQPDLATTSDAAPAPEEPDNAAEHLLMPSQRGDGPVGVSLLAGISADFEVSFIAPYPTDSAAAVRADPHNEWPIRSSPVSFLLPLRI